MHPDHVAKLLKNPKLAGVEDVVSRPSSPSPPTSYHSGMDAAFEQAAATYEAGKSNYKFGGESPLAAISVDPIGRFWYSAWSTCLLGGTYTHACEYTHLLLPVLRNAKSPFVLDLAFRALRSIHRNSESSLGPNLYEELGEALETYTRTNRQEEVTK